MADEEMPKEEPLIPPIEVKPGADAEALARHYAQLYKAGTGPAYKKLGHSVEVKPKIERHGYGSATITFDVKAEPN